MPGQPAVPGEWILTGNECGSDELCCPDSFVAGLGDGTFGQTVHFSCVNIEECDCGIGNIGGTTGGTGQTGGSGTGGTGGGGFGDPCLGTCWWVWQNNEWVIGTGSFYPNDCASNDGCMCGGQPTDPPSGNNTAQPGFCYSSLGAPCGYCVWTWLGGEWVLTENGCSDSSNNSLCCPHTQLEGYPDGGVEEEVIAPPIFCEKHPDCNCGN